MKVLQNFLTFDQMDYLYVEPLQGKRLAWDEVQIFGWGVDAFGPTQRN
tara:strand:+ start:431 stop:574 length:144 start_codon:yes stop_codon:yes gene_type:complete